jgi:hypothetical protein
MENQAWAFKAIISSDWSECLSPSGPFDFLAFHHPHLEAELSRVFRRYTGNEITLGEAGQRIRSLLPGPVTEEMMDAYLDRSFAAYPGVADLIEWCLSHGILFMINTTAMIGYFQRVFAKKLLPRVPVLSANPLVRYAARGTDPGDVRELIETRDKGKNTAVVVRHFGIPAGRIVVMGDSGGDGPHFEWAARAGAFTIGSMTKHSLSSYCRDRDIPIHLRFGVSYGDGEGRDVEKEKQFDFMDLVEPLQAILTR